MFSLLSGGSEPLRDGLGSALNFGVAGYAIGGKKEFPIVINEYRSVLIGH